MKKRFIKLFTVIAMLVFSLGIFTACFAGEKEESLSYDNGVVMAFNSITSPKNMVSKTAVKWDESYVVTVIASDSVVEYSLDNNFGFLSKHDVLGQNVTIADINVAEPQTVGMGLEKAYSEPQTAMTELEKAYSAALELSGIAPENVTGFDFDKETFMGNAAYKVEIEDADAEYTYIFKAEDMSVLNSKTELKNTGKGNGESSYIGEERAENIALTAAGIDNTMAVGLSVKSGFYEGRKLYKVSFDYNGYRYKIDIDALNGNIVKYSQTVLDETALNPEVGGNISEQEAKDIALNFVFPQGVDGEVSFRKVKLDYERGKFIYEIEFTVDNNEYEFEISASDGQILDFEIDEKEDKRLPQNDKYLTREEAVAKVKEKVGEDIFVVDTELEKKGGEYFYEIEVKIGDREYEYFVNASDGTVTLNEEYAGNQYSPAISKERALQIALDNFGLSSEQIAFQKIKLENDDGKLIYEIDFTVGKTRYSVEIDAQSGVILEFECDTDDNGRPPVESDIKITQEQAVEIVKKELGENIVVKDVELDFEGKGENRRYYYEIEVVFNGREYDYHVDANTGEIIRCAEDVVTREVIGEQRALEIAFEYFSVAKSEARGIEVKLEKDDGRLIYEVEFKIKSMEYEIEIDAVTGEVLDSDRSFDD